LQGTKFGGRSWRGEVLRLAILGTHYRQPLDFTVKALDEAEKTLDKWYLSRGYDDLEGPLPQPIDRKEAEDPDFLAALEDDLNTPRAIARLHELYSEIKGPTSGYPQIQLKRKVTRSAQLLGLLKMKSKNWFMQKMNLDERVIALRDARNAARAQKNWAEADRIRNEFAKIGIALQNNPDGTTTLHYHHVSDTGRYEKKGSYATPKVKR
jgi:cysteinyl-tRNA synthetase